MYLSMQGCGVGFAVESQNVEQLPQITETDREKSYRRIIVDDSKEGWCDALTLGAQNLVCGKDIDFDFSEVRPAGARLLDYGREGERPRATAAIAALSRASEYSRAPGRRLRTIDAARHHLQNRRMRRLRAACAARR